MKSLLLNLILISLAVSLQGQTTTGGRFRNPYDRYVQVDFSGGANIDLIGSTDASPNRGLFTTRTKKSAPFGKVTISHFPFRRVGWYGALQLNFYDEKDNQRLPSGAIDQFVTAFLKGVTGPLLFVHPSYELGLLYRFEQNRWRLHPKIGIGQFGYLTRETGSRSTGDGQEAVYSQKAQPLCLSTGVSGSYFFSRKAYLTVDLQYLQPVQHSSASIVYSINSVETERWTREMSTAGRSMNVGLGIGLVIE